MFTRILTSRERRRIRDYLKTDGKRDSTTRSLASRARKHIPEIHADLELLETFINRYEKTKGAFT